MFEKEETVERDQRYWGARRERWQHGQQGAGRSDAVRQEIGQAQRQEVEGHDDVDADDDEINAVYHNP